MVLGRAAERGELAWSIIDLQKMQPTGGNVLEPLNPVVIRAIALRVKDIVLELAAIIDQVRG